MEHIVIRTRAVFSELYGPDLHIFIDGRRSPRTRRAQILNDWHNWIADRERHSPFAEPLTPTGYIRLGVNDPREHPVHFVTSTQRTWTVDENWTLFTYRPHSTAHGLEPYNRLIHTNGTMYTVDVDLDLAAKKHRGSHWKTHATVTIRDTDGNPVAVGQQFDTKSAFRVALENLTSAHEGAAA